MVPAGGLALSRPALHLQRRGAGPAVLFIHGSAADHTTWAMQAALAASLELVTYDRRGSGASPPAPAGVRVEDHAADAAVLIDEQLGGGPVLVCGSSFGAVVSLELARSRPELVRGLVLCEPPMPCHDDLPAMPQGFGCAFDARVATLGGEAGGAFFLQLVLGPAYDCLPARYQARAAGEWRAIRADCLALQRYRPRYRELGAVVMPVLLVAGERSVGHFDATIDSLQLHLPDARLVTLPRAGHMMQAERFRLFNNYLAEFAGV